MYCINFFRDGTCNHGTACRYSHDPAVKAAVERKHFLARQNKVDNRNHAGKGYGSGSRVGAAPKGNPTGGKGSASKASESQVSVGSAAPSIPGSD